MRMRACGDGVAAACAGDIGAAGKRMGGQRVLVADADEEEEAVDVLIAAVQLGIARVY